MTNKFRQERYIQQLKYSNGKWAFRVRYKNIDRYFYEKDYLDSSTAFKEAVRYRNSLLTKDNVMVYKKLHKTIYDVFEESYEILPVRLKTKRNHHSMYDNHIKDYTTLIEDMNDEYITLKLNSLIEDCSDHMIKRIRTLFDRITKTALIKRYIDYNYMQGIRVPKSIAFKEKKEKTINEEQLEKIINNCNSVRYSYARAQYPLILKTLYYTGMRPCELFALNKSDITDVITINKELGSNITKSKTIRQCKSLTSNRYIPISSELRVILDKAIEISRSDVLFPNEDGTYRNVNNTSHQITLIAKRVGIDFNLYQLRHLFATNLLRMNVDIRTIQELMGHNSKTMTIYYANSSKELKKSAVDLLKLTKN